MVKELLMLKLHRKSRKKLLRVQPRIRVKKSTSMLYSSVTSVRQLLLQDLYNVKTDNSDS
jgi:hypothetical protein